MRNGIALAASILIMYGAGVFAGCNIDRPGRKNEPVSSSGVTQTRVDVPVGPNGTTVEQDNVARRLLMDNEPGSVKHLYIVSAMSGDCILYSTVEGKVTSSGKRLAPTSVVGNDFEMVDSDWEAMKVEIGGHGRFTREVIQDDGTYGSSIDYLYWWDVRGNYHQHYPSGGQIIHVSDVPMSWPKIVLNLEQSGASE